MRLKAPQHKTHGFWHELRKSTKLISFSILIGLQIALLIFYYYTLYHDETRAVTGIRDTLSYQGKIVNADGVPLPDQKYNMRFAIYDEPRNVGQPNGGTLLWTEVWDGTTKGADGLVDPPNQENASQVDVKNGIFNVELNSLCRNWVGTGCATNGGVTFKDDSVYLQVELDYDPIDNDYEEIFLPRKRFTATPYAMNADKLDGWDAEDFVLQSGEATLTKITDSSIIGYYKFDNGSVDSSGATAAAGILEGGATIANNILNLTGANLDNFNLNILNSTFNLNTGSVSLWVNRSFANDTANFGTIFSAKTNADNVLDVYYDPVTDQWIFEYVAGGIIKQTLVPADQIPVSTWTYLTFTWDKDNDFSVYINGVLYDVAVTDLGVWAGDLAGISIGSDSITHTSNFMGKIDEVKILNRVLSVDEVLAGYDAASKNEIQANRLSALELDFQIYENGQPEGGFLRWDNALNRFVFSQELYAPNLMPYFNNTVADRDYTYISDANKLLAYDFHESEGQTVYDLSGNDYNATLAGDAYWTNLGYIGYGLKFDDTEDYVTFANPQLVQASGSIELWAKFNGLAKNQDNYLFKLGNGSTEDVTIYRHYVDETNPANIYLKFGDSATLDSNWDVPDNNWHYYVLTWNNLSFDLFIDGVKVLNDQYCNYFTPGGYDSFYLGAANTTSGSLDGFVDSFAIYSDVLTNREITNHYHGAFYDLSVINNLSDGLINTTLSNLNNFPATLNEKNRLDPAATNPSNVLLGLPFSEGKGTTTVVMNSGGVQANINGPRWINDGYYSYALDFDGVNDNVTMTDGSLYNLGSGNYSIEFWFRGLGDNPGKVIMSKKDSNNIGWEIYLDESDRLGVYLSDGTLTFNPTPTSSDISDGSWHHVAINIDQTSVTKSVTEIIDGFNVNYFDFTSLGLGSLENAQPLTIGGNSQGNNIKGALDSIYIYNDRLLTLYEIFGRLSNSPDYMVTVNNNTMAGLAPLASINQNANGNGGIFWLNNSSNSEYPLLISNNSAASDVYKLLTFGTGLMSTWTEFGNLKWDNTNTKFILSNNLEVQGEIQTKYLKTVGEDAIDNELLAYDIVRQTVTTDDVSNGYLDITWNKIATKKVANLHAICVDESDTYDTVSADDWTTGSSFDLGVLYDGSKIRVTKQNGTWESDDIVTVFISYEK